MVDVCAGYVSKFVGQERRHETKPASSACSDTISTEAGHSELADSEWSVLIEMMSTKSTGDRGGWRQVKTGDLESGDVL